MKCFPDTDSDDEDDDEDDDYVWPGVFLKSTVFPKREI